jgi:hypothetical protein
MRHNFSRFSFSKRKLGAAHLGVAHPANTPDTHHKHAQEADACNACNASNRHRSTLYATHMLNLSDLLSPTSDGGRIKCPVRAVPAHLDQTAINAVGVFATYKLSRF